MSESFEQQPEQEKPSTISKIVGTYEEVNKKTKEAFGKVFELDQETWDFENEKTAEELAVIEETLTEFAKFSQSYKVSPVPMTASHIHIINDSKLEETTEYEHEKAVFKNGSAAFFQMYTQAIWMLASKIRSKTELAARLSHELIHANGFSSLVINKQDKESELFDIYRRRGGFIIDSRDREHIYFHGIDEAIVEHLAKRFFEIYLRHSPLLAEEQEQTEKVRALLKEQDPENTAQYDDIYYAKELEDRSFDYYMHSYPKERHQLDRIMQDIFEKFPDKFSSTEDVFNEFVRAHTTGKILTIARLINETYKDKKIPGISGRDYSSHLKENNEKRPFSFLAKKTKKNLNKNL